MIYMYFDTIGMNEIEEGLVEEDPDIVDVEVKSCGYKLDNSYHWGLMVDNEGSFAGSKKIFPHTPRETKSKSLIRIFVRVGSKNGRSSTHEETVWYREDTVHSAVPDITLYYRKLKNILDVRRIFNSADLVCDEGRVPQSFWYMLYNNT